MDPMTLAVIWRGLISAANDAGLTLKRTAYSAAVREGRDFSVGLFDARGRMIAQGDFSPGHLGAMPSVLAHIHEVYPPEELGPGDAIFLNDLYMGSGHLLDCFLASPVFAGEELVGYVVSCAHMADVGGAVPGSQAVEGIADHYQEGLRFLPTRLWRRGAASSELMRVISANVRVPDTVLGDVQAMRHGNLVGERRLRELFDDFGGPTFRTACDELLAASEQAMREGIASWPDVTVEAEDFFDDYGPGTDPLRVHLRLSVRGEEVHLDFSESSDQTKSGINAVKNYLDSYCYFSIKAVMDSGRIPQNAGSIRPISITCRPGSVLNAQPPAGGGARAIMQQRIVDVVCQALAGVVPDRVLASSSHWGNPIVGGLDPVTGQRFVHYEVMVGGFGGRAHSDGVEAMSASFNIDGIPVEVAEATTPVVVERLEFIEDSAGAGRHRGGHGIRKDIRVRGEDLLLTNLGDRHRFAPDGVLGGQPGARARTVLNPDTPGERELDSKGKYELAHDDVVSFRLSGAGGYGDPRERDPELVRADLRAGLLSQAKHDEVYTDVAHDGQQAPRE